jgi:hypothetical protein
MILKKEKRSQVKRDFIDNFYIALQTFLNFIPSPMLNIFRDYLLFLKLNLAIQ